MVCTKLSSSIASTITVCFEAISWNNQFKIIFLLHPENQHESEGFFTSGDEHFTPYSESSLISSTPRTTNKVFWNALKRWDNYAASHFVQFVICGWLSCSRGKYSRISDFYFHFQNVPGDLTTLTKDNIVLMLGVMFHIIHQMVKDQLNECTDPFISYLFTKRSIQTHPLFEQILLLCLACALTGHGQHTCPLA